jgi:hypothetical protein
MRKGCFTEVGGFLGMGEKDVAVPLQFGQDHHQGQQQMVSGHEFHEGRKSANGFKYDRNAMTWIPEDAPASTGTPAPAAPRQNR